MPTPTQSTDSLDASIQAALKAVGSGPSQVPDDTNDLAIQAAVQALDKPVRVITPDKGPSDFLSGGYGGFGDALRRGAGATGGVANILSTLPRMAIGGAAAVVAAPLHAMMPNTFASPSDVLDQGMQNGTIPLSGEYARGGEYTQGIAGKAVQGAVDLGGTGAAGMADMLFGKPKTLAEQAKREALTRTGGETAINAALMVIGGKAGEEAIAEKPSKGPEITQPIDSSVPPRGTSDETSPEVTPVTDFQSRMQAAVPNKAAPEPVTPAVQEANVSALEQPYRATPADPVSVFPKLPKYLAGARPKYGDVTLQFQSDLDRAAYIVGNPRTSSARHADYLEWLGKALGTDENTALFLAKRSLAATRAAVKGGQEGPIPAYLKPAQAGQAPSIPIDTATVHEAAQGAPATVQGSPAALIDKALEGSRLTRTPIPPGREGEFASDHNLRIGVGDGQPLPYVQYVHDVYPSVYDEIINSIGEKVIQEGKGNPTTVHLSPDDLRALNQALTAKGWPKHRVDILEKVAAALDYAKQNRQTRNEGFAPMRGQLLDHKILGDVLKNPENYAVTARLDEFKPSRDFEKVCTP